MRSLCTGANASRLWECAVAGGSTMGGGTEGTADAGRLPLEDGFDKRRFRCGMDDDGIASLLLGFRSGFVLPVELFVLCCSTNLSF